MYGAAAAPVGARTAPGNRRDAAEVGVRLGHVIEPVALGQQRIEHRGGEAGLHPHDVTDRIQARRVDRVLGAAVPVDFLHASAGGAVSAGRYLGGDGRLEIVSRSTAEQWPDDAAVEVV